MEEDSESESSDSSSSSVSSDEEPEGEKAMATQHRGSADDFRRRKDQDRERTRERGYRREVPHGQDEEAKRAREEALLKRKNAEPCDLCGERGHWKRDCPKAREGRR